MINYQFMLTDSMEKIFSNQAPRPIKQALFPALKGETISFQLAYRMEYNSSDLIGQRLTLETDFKWQNNIQISDVKLVPSNLPAFYVEDENYITKQPGLFPDLLIPKKDNILKPMPFQWKSVWFQVSTRDLPSGTHPLQINLIKNDILLWTSEVLIEISNASLPKQTLFHTEWFHADCLANYYHVPVFSEEHFRIIENFVQTAVDYGCNTLLTPVFTPPLDTAVGGERTTVQLVKIIVEKGCYFFDFTLLRKWIAMCKKCHIDYLEISHLFTQWGAAHAPKIMGEVDGTETRIFGWETEATSKEYADFLAQFIPALKKVLEEEHILSHTIFHVSDEPDEWNLASYSAAKDIIWSYIKDCMVIDASSSLLMYQKGIVRTPVVANNHIKPFIKAGVSDLWVYYCCAQGEKVPNRFMAMPSVRNRAMGLLMYLYHIKGFLHWGYNFYNSQNSTHAINPYQVTDAEEAFPSGDPFLVYPSDDGSAYPSIRIIVQAEALYDMRVLELLEKLAGREKVIELIAEEFKEEITFEHYPLDPNYYLNLRKKINRVIQEMI